MLQGVKCKFNAHKMFKRVISRVISQIAVNDITVRLMLVAMSSRRTEPTNATDPERTNTTIQITPKHRLPYGKRKQ
jgi:hypothetical protein